MGVNQKGAVAFLFVAPFLSNLSCVWKPQNAPITRAALLRYFCVHFQLAIQKGVLSYEKFYTNKPIATEFGGKKT